MNDNMANAKREALFNLLDEVMTVFLDNKSVNLNNHVFGTVRETRKSPGNPGANYLLSIQELPPALIRLTTSADPMDYSENRMKVAVVPVAFTILFTGTLIDVDRHMLEKRLDLTDYWIDSETGERKANDMGSGYPPQSRIHGYRYRANDHANTRVPVNVQLDYSGPDSSHPGESPQLLYVSIRRAYEFLTPKQREQKREEKEQRARELYGNPAATK